MPQSPVAFERLGFVWHWGPLSASAVRGKPGKRQSSGGNLAAAITKLEPGRGCQPTAASQVVDGDD